MGWREFFGIGAKKPPTPPGPDPIADLTLARIQVGYMIDYDMKTWQVEAYHYYDWGHGEITHEWQLKSHDDTIYLERESDDEDAWAISRKVSLGRLGAGVREHLKTNDDPPDEIVYEGVTYYLEEWAGGNFHKNGKGPAQEMLAWDYEDDTGQKFLSIEQWDEEDFEAAVGEPVEEYQFTNILPGAGTPGI